ncbi:MAG: GNAT family N-acetyltransferase [Hyphomicrobiaceae bacterium]|nr:GNAT family N-acetyltransferase [Hyphomicrobiaceae bacterium]
MEAKQPAAVRVAASMADIDAAQWDACANPDASVFNPFVSHAFLDALEKAGTLGPRAGWLPHHLVIDGPGGDIAGAMPCYLKSHSRGEYVFDYGWAEAYERAGGRYYPKLQCAVPFTPVPGPRLLARPGPQREECERTLAAAAISLAERLGVSSLHVTFPTEGEWQRLAGMGFLQRTDQQFQWRNGGYHTFEDFLSSLASRKRKAVRKERAQALAGGIGIEHVTGRDIREAHWDAFFGFYLETGSRKWGRPYLNRRFFSLLGAAMADRCLLVMARRDGRYVAGALNMIGGDCLYGRYWGAVEHHPCLHFEICYYQAIEIAIGRGLRRVEAGAQGEHKLARGYMPAPTYSLHWIADRNFRRAVARYLEDERRQVAEHSELLAAYGPFRKAESEEAF